MQVDPKELQDCKNCLAHLKTPDEIARRRYPDDQDEDSPFTSPYLPPFFTDARNKILQSKALRRLSAKTHVFTNEQNVHVRTRLSHSLDVAYFASTICQILGLNSELAFAIGLGHDLGHPPLGHAGEQYISSILGKPFRHEKMSVIVAQHIERHCTGLNLTHQVLQGFLNHSLGEKTGYIDPALLPEINAVRLADTITNTLGNFNDLYRKFHHRLSDLPQLKEAEKIIRQLGKNQRARTNYFLYSICLESAQKRTLSFSDSETPQLLNACKQKLYQVYPQINFPDTKHILECVHEFLSKNEKRTDPILLLALMTNHDVFQLYQAWQQERTTLDLDPLRKCSVYDLLPFLREKQIDLTNPDLNW